MEIQTFDWRKTDPSSKRRVAARAHAIHHLPRSSARPLPRDDSAATALGSSDMKRGAYPSPTVPAAASVPSSAPSTRPNAPSTADETATTPQAAPAQRPGRSRLTLERVLGVTALSNAMMAVNPVSGEIAYAAGCIVVIYNLRRNKQVRYYRVDKCVSCLCFSPNGQFLAIGEKGYMPAITIWDGSNGALCAELQLHKFGVACMAFNRDGSVLLSAGLVHDQHVYAWRLERDDNTGSMTSRAIGVAQIQEKILSADFCQEGNFFVTVGERHFKFWSLKSDEGFEITGFQVNDIPELHHKDAILPTKDEATFTSVGCGYGTCSLKTFAVASDGTLCCFGENGTMERLVSLETPAGYALSVTGAYIAVGGASSVVRLFDPETLEYRATLPFTPAFGSANHVREADDNGGATLCPDHPHRYPAAIAVRVTGSHVAALYSDRSLFIYDVSNIDSVQIERSFLFHCGGIREMQVVGRVRGVNGRGKLVYESDQSSNKLDPSSAGEILPIGAFVTCSDDNTARIWHLDLHKKPAAPVSRFDHNANSKSAASEAWSNPFSQEMLAVVYHDSDQDFEDDGSIVLGGCCSYIAAPDIHEPAKDRGQATGLRTLAIRPDHHHLAVGDNDGNVRVVPLPIGTPTLNLSSHSAEVQSIAFAGISSADSNGNTTSSGSMKYIMASGSRDRLVQVYDCNKNYSAISTLENHSGAVTKVAFANDGSKLLSSGADKMMVFSNVNAMGAVSRYNSVPFNGGKIFDFALTSDSKMVVAASNNRLDMFALSTGKHIKSHHVGEQHHMDVSPGNVCVAVSGSISDKTIHVIDLETGETLANATGHGEAITSVRFTPDCRRLLSTSNDGCIFVWRLSDDIQATIKASLPRVVDLPVHLPSPPKKAVVAVPTPLAVLMPPPPPLPVPKQPTPRIVAEAKTPPKPQLQRSAKKKTVALEKSTMMPSTDTSAISQPKMGWKGKASAAPGPMSGVPMEEWMRTRESAKKTIPVAGSTTSKPPTPPRPTKGGIDLSSPDKSAYISIDRSQTPDWARTAAPAHHQGGNKSSEGSPVHCSKIPAPQLPRGKWGERVGERKASPKKELQSPSKVFGVASTMPSDSPRVQSSSRLHISKSEDEAEGESPGIRSLEKSKLMGLSVDDLDISSKSSLRESTSLALEREQLEKRQKQIDTANAVAAMNLKLSQLGLLKPKDERERRASGCPPPIFPDAPSPSKSEPGAERVQGNLNSIEPRYDTAKITGTQSDDDSESVGYNSSSSSSSRSEDTEEVSEQEETKIEAKQSATNESSDTGILRPDIPLEMLESIDIPLSTRGMQLVSPVAEKDGIDTCPNYDTVNNSLSTFTQGFTVQSDTSEIQALSQKKSSLPVDCSLSAFSEGYARDLREQISEQKPTVAASLSMFTTGYQPAPSEVSEDTSTSDIEIQVHQPDNALIAVDCSISSFTTGYNAVTPHALSTQQSSHLETMQSISAFTSGYSANSNAERACESAVVPSVAASFSTFTSGYEVSEDVHHASTDSNAVTPLPDGNNELETTKSAELRGSEMDSELEDGTPHDPEIPETKTSARHQQVMQSLSSFTSGYEFVSLPLSQSEPSSDEEGSMGNAPAPTVNSTISALDEHLRAASRVLQDIPSATDSPAKGPELERIQELVGQLRAAIRRLDSPPS